MAGLGASLVFIYFYVTRRLLPKLMPGLTVGTIGALVTGFARRPAGKP